MANTLTAAALRIDFAFMISPPVSAIECFWETGVGHCNPGA